ncbi:ATPase [Bordetella sp. H567]|uniref:ATPase n=1 Tax=Bordetella sp. H567 TaxID=1697043 RepID=UPI00081D192F|nr:ATPase [Bordetella sp. H567]AOB33167.1 ATPase [Bordetella sp. H567]
MFHYPRPGLASELVQSLRGQTLFGDAPNGVFLAAPRRTGKSTFLQVDLTPALQAAGVVVTYVDLWSDPQRDPALLIARAIGKTLAAQGNIVGRAAKKAGLASITLAGVKFDLEKLGTLEGAPLPDALRALHEATQAPVALIVDEAQHALTSEAGEAVMAALKSARDQLNRPWEVNLMLVMSGSDRDKLLRLVNTNGAPFYGSQITRMPLLDSGFTDFIAERIEAQRADLGPVDRRVLFEAFQVFGHRPQFFLRALEQALSPVAMFAGRFEDAVSAAANQQRLDDVAQMESEFLALKPLEQAVLWRMLEQGEHFRPYDSAALKFYREQSHDKVTAAAAQRALESLRARTPALVWKSARGEYAVDDAAMHAWYRQRIQDGAWPPTLP